MTIGTKDLKEIVVFFCRMTNAIDKSLADGKVNFTDAVNFYGPLQAISEAYDGAKNAIAEFKDLDEKEKQDIVDTIVLELDLTADVVEEIVEDIIESALDFYMNYKKISILVKSKKTK